MFNSIVFVFRLLNYVWWMLFILEYITIILLSKIDGVIINPIRDFCEKESGKAMIDSQPVLFISMYNAAIMTAYICTRKAFFIIFGMPIGTILLYISLAGDIVDILGIWTRKQNNTKYLDRISARYLIISALFGVLAGAFSSEYVVREIDNCSKIYACFEVLVFVMLLYVLIATFLSNKHIIIGCMCLRCKTNYPNRISKALEEKRILKANLHLFINKLEDKYEKQRIRLGKAGNLILFIPYSLILCLVMIVSYWKQIVRNSKIILYIFLDNWITNNKEIMDDNKFSKCVEKNRYNSIIISLITVYLWSSFAMGTEHDITRILNVFATIVIIPIAINRMTAK